MNQQWFHKPENALRRANELDAVGNKLGALKLLHDLISQRKNRQWQKSFEDIMCRYMDLAVEQQNFRAAKDGLHQYRNMSQQQAPGSLEVVIVYLLDLGEKKAAEAQASVSETVRAKAAKITDLDEETSPEMIMLSTMTDEGDRERADRALLVPWLRFLWETYRAVLDILRTNSKLEHVYVEGALLLLLVLARVVLLRRTATATAPLHLYCYYQPTHPPLSQVHRQKRMQLPCARARTRTRPLSQPSSTCRNPSTLAARRVHVEAGRMAVPALAASKPRGRSTRRLAGGRARPCRSRASSRAARPRKHSLRFESPTSTRSPASPSTRSTTCGGG